MQNILISLKKPASPELIDAILVALSSGWGEASVSVAGNTTVIGFGNDDVEPAPVPEPAATSDTCDMGTVAPPEDVMAAIQAIEIPAMTADEPLSVPYDVANPVANPAPVGLPNAVIKSFSLSTQVHAVYDPIVPETTLKVKNVSEVGDLLVFTFGGVEYKYPMADHKINVVVSFAGKETEQISCTLVVVSTDGNDELVFGQNDVSKISGFLGQS